MSHLGPPGLSKNPSHPSLPPRPPASKLSGFKPAFSTATTTSAPPITSTAPGYHSGYSNSTAGYGVAGAPGAYAPPPDVSSYGAAPQHPSVGVAGRGCSQPGSYNYTQQSYAQQPSYYSTAPAPAPSVAAAPASNNYSTPPQIRNPFPLPGGPAQSAVDFDPEMAAQIAQWQSAYMPKDPSEPTVKASGAGGRSGANAPTAGGQTAATSAEAVDGNTGGTGEEKKKTVYREGGGKKWHDDTLLEWDPAHLRLFVGNLAGETTDDSLLKAFSRWKSVQRAKVIRDKRTTKSKGFGFVSFSDPEDFFQAAKEMNGKYIQSHPVVVHKAKTEVKPAALKDERKGGKHNKKGGNGKKSGSGAGGHDGTAYEPHLGPMGGGGVTKPGQKTRGGLKLLG